MVIKTYYNVDYNEHLAILSAIRQTERLIGFDYSNKILVVRSEAKAKDCIFI